MFWHASVLPSINLSVHRGGYPYPIMLCNISQNAMGQTPGGYPYPIMLCNISQNAMGQTPGGGVPYWGVPCQGGTLQGGALWGVPCRGVPAGGIPCWGDPAQGGSLLGGYPAPVRTTEGVLTTRRAVCLLRSRRRTFLFFYIFKQLKEFSVVQTLCFVHCSVAWLFPAMLPSAHKLWQLWHFEPCVVFECVEICMVLMKILLF